VDLPTLPDHCCIGTAQSFPNLAVVFQSLGRKVQTALDARRTWHSGCCLFPVNLWNGFSPTRKALSKTGGIQCAKL